MTEPIPYSPGTPVARITVGHTTALVRVHRWLDGVSLDWRGIHPSHAHALGTTLAAVHGLDLASDAKPTDVLTIIGANQWKQIEQEARALEVPWLDDLVRHKPAIARAEELVELSRNDPFEVRLTHKDVNPRNVMITPDGRANLVDWDAAGPYPIRVEVALTVLTFAAASDNPLETATALIDRYRAAGGVFAEPRAGDVAAGLSGLLWWTAFNARDSLRDRTTRSLDGYVGALLAALTTHVDTLDARVQLLRAAAGRAG